MKPSFTKLSLLALPVFALTACQDFEPFDEAEVHATMAEREFTNNFIKHYGQPDPNHSWGFEEMECVNMSATRALVSIPTGSQRNDNVNTERNNWPSWNLQIPGWPNFDGKYYDSENQTSYKKFDSNPGLNGVHPCGDVTDYEVDYVSRWFRTYGAGSRELESHKVQLHLSDFFVQNVSSDNDRKKYPEGDLVTTTLGEGNKEFGMDHLMFKSIEANSQGYQWTHVNDFNSGNSNHNPEHYVANDGTITPKPDDANTNRVIKYVKSAGTEDFAYHSSFSDQEDYYFDKWVLVRLTWEEEGIPREGYYLAFDYEAKKNSSNEVYGPDGYYSNWIIKITPASYIPEDSKSKVSRVMCEDLGNTFDFDFNDVVFDVSFEQVGSTYDAIITLQAAGGTMPIYVGKTPSAAGGVYEAHRMLVGPPSTDTGTPVNVGSGKTTGTANYRVTGLTSTNPEVIDIYVVNNGETISLTSGHNLGDNYHNENVNMHEGNKPGIGSNNVPQRFCVPTTVQWMKECKFIETGYPLFDSWAKAETENLDWYKTVNPSATGNIYNYNPATADGDDSTPTTKQSPFVSNVPTDLELQVGDEIDLAQYMKEGVTPSSITVQDNSKASISGTKITGVADGNTFLVISYDGDETYAQANKTINLKVKQVVQPTGYSVTLTDAQITELKNDPKHAITNYLEKGATYTITVTTSEANKWVQISEQSGNNAGNQASVANGSFDIVFTRPNNDYDVVVSNTDYITAMTIKKN